MAAETGDTDLNRQFEEMKVSDKNWKFKHVVIKNPLLEGMMTSTGLKDPQLTMHLRFDSPNEACIEIAVSFATKPDSPYSRKNVHYKAMRFYWHAFGSAREDITLSKVIGLDDSMEEDSFLTDNSWRDQLWMLTLTYNPENLVDFHLNEDAEYLKEDIARDITYHLRSLKRPMDPGENKKTIHVYLSDTGKAPMMQTRFDQLVTRLEEDRAAPCLSEYHRKDGSPLLNWGDTACGYNIDREKLPRKTRFRTHEDNILTHGIGELREAGATFDLLPRARVTKLQMHFIAVGALDEHQQSRRYLVVGQGYLDSRLRRLLEIGEVGTLSFAKEKPPNHRFPTLNGWKYTVRSPLATFGISNDLVLDVFRNKHDDHGVPMKSMKDDIKPDQDVYLSPDPSDVSGRLLVRATKRMIQGTGPDFDKLRGSPSNAALNALLEHLVRNDQNAGYGVRPLRYAGVFEEIKAMVALYRVYHSTDVPGVALAGIVLDHDENDQEIDILRSLATADSQHRSKRFAGLLDRSSLHCQILEQAGILVDKRLEPSTGNEINEDDPLAKFRSLFLDPDSPTYASDLPGSEKEKSAKETYRAGAETTFRAKPTPPKPRSPTISSVTKKAMAIVASKAACVVTTCVSAGDRFISKNFHPRAVFIDDAGPARGSEFCNTVIGALERRELALVCLVADTERSRPIFAHKPGKVGVSGYCNPMADQLKTGLVAQLTAENYPHVMLREKF